VLNKTNTVCSLEHPDSAAMMKPRIHLKNSSENSTEDHTQNGAGQTLKLNVSESKAENEDIRPDIHLEKEYKPLQLYKYKDAEKAVRKSQSSMKSHGIQNQLSNMHEDSANKI
jgi:hypothetical protein